MEILKIDLDIKKELLTPVVEFFLKKQIEEGNYSDNGFMDFDDSLDFYY